ncbi:hypothetical protein QQ054_23360 [Oscillatoria amoena NRMC-F 0135]|nr:hypothetical protein [Oscillatoria amoena NRMC-F 0135]
MAKTETKELAVMIDPFNPVKITRTALELEVDGYYKSWLFNNPKKEILETV